MVSEGIYEDFEAMNQISGLGNFKVKEVNYSTPIDEGYRRILLVVKWKKVGNVIKEADYHYFMRHPNGTWSHKPGRTKVTDKLVCYTELNGDDVEDTVIYTNITLTDDNIDSLCSANDYSAYKQYYDISKPYTFDYPYLNGNINNRTKVDLVDFLGRRRRRY